MRFVPKVLNLTKIVDFSWATPAQKLRQKSKLVLFFYLLGSGSLLPQQKCLAMTLLSELGLELFERPSYDIYIYIIYIYIHMWVCGCICVYMHTHTYTHTYIYIILRRKYLPLCFICKKNKTKNEYTLYEKTIYEQDAPTFQIISI